MTGVPDSVALQFQSIRTRSNDQHYRTASGGDRTSQASSAIGLTDWSVRSLPFAFLKAIASFSNTALGQIIASFALLAVLLLAGCKQTSSPVTTEPQPTSNQANKMQQVTGPVNYVAIGDSTGLGVGAVNGGYVSRLFKRIEHNRPGSKLLNLCVSGATSEDVQRSQLNRAIAAKPTLVTLGIGINDMGRGFSVETTAANINEIVSRLKNETPARIVVTNLPDISPAPAIPRALRPEIQRRIEQLNQRISEIGARHGVSIVDIYTSTHQLLTDHPEYFSRDGFHPSDAGYEVWAEQMWPAVAETLGVNPK